MMRRASVVALCVTLLAPALWAAGGTEAPAATPEKMTITTIAFNNRGAPAVKDTPVERLFEARFGVDIEVWEGIDGYAPEQINVRIAGGDIPDLWRGVVTQLREMGAIREVPEEALRKYMPRYIAQCEEVSGNDFWANSLASDGKNFGIPTALSISAAGPALGIRSDWMAKVGWTKKIDTLADLEELLTRFVEQDPDGNGKKDTVGIIDYKNGASLQVDAFGYLFGAFGIRLRTWEKQTNHIEYSMVKPGYKDALKVMASWYRKGIIAPEYPVMVRKQFDELIVGDKVGAFDNWSSWHSQGPWFQKMQGQNIEVQYVVSPAGPTGLRGNYSRPAGPWGNPGVIGFQVSDAKMAKILQIIDEIYSDPKLFAALFLGVEGKDFSWNDDGSPTAIVTDYAELAKSGVGIFRMDSVLPAVEKVYVPRARYPIHNWIRKSEVKLDYGFTPTFTPEQKTVYSTINTYESEFYFGVMTGKINPDAEWDNYVKKMNDLGLKDLLATATDQYLKRK